MITGSALVRQLSYRWGGAQQVDEGGPEADVHGDQQYVEVLEADDDLDDHAAGGAVEGSGRMSMIMLQGGDAVCRQA